MPSGDILTTIMQYVIGGLLSIISLVIWGIIFYRKEPERRDLVIFSFCAGVLSVVPIFLVLGIFGSSTFSIANFNIPGLNIYDYIVQVSSTHSMESLMVFIIASIIAFFAMYLVVGMVIFLLDIISGEQSLSSFKKILNRSIEAPFIFITLGIFMGLLAYIFDWSLHELLWKNLLVGAVEEFAKHLVLRFSDSNKFRSINDVIEFSILVALGFAFLENITYFVDRIWMQDCVGNNCVISYYTDPITQTIQQKSTQPVGELLVPVIFRSTFSTLTHVIASGILGYFFGLAYFAGQEIKEYAKRPKTFIFRMMAFFHRVFNISAETVYREEKILEGAFIAILFHGIFNFILEGQVNEYFKSQAAEGTNVFMKLFGGGTSFIIVPMIFIGCFILIYLLRKPENRATIVKRNLLKNPNEIRLIKKQLLR